MYVFDLFNLSALGFSSIMALTDVLVLGSLKAYNLGWIKWPGIIGIAMLVYSFQPLIFLQSLGGNTLTVMNLMWDVVSDVFVTMLGLYYFHEKLNSVNKAGLMLSFIALFMLSWK